MVESDDQPDWYYRDRDVAVETVAKFAANAEGGIGVRDTMRKAFDQLAFKISSFEHGSGAELRRLKDFLGADLPVDWEMRRMERLVTDKSNGQSDT